jgi:hypothetical protein
VSGLAFAAAGAVWLALCGLVMLLGFVTGRRRDAALERAWARAQAVERDRLGLPGDLDLRSSPWPR